MYMYNFIANRDLLGQDRKRRMVRGDVQRRRWTDNARKIIGPQWSIQQDGGKGRLIRPVCPPMTGRHDEIDRVGLRRQVVFAPCCEEEGHRVANWFELCSDRNRLISLQSVSLRGRDGKIRHLLTD